jgi:hypothetical protein
MAAGHSGFASHTATPTNNLYQAMLLDAPGQRESNPTDGENRIMAKKTKTPKRTAKSKAAAQATTKTALPAVPDVVHTTDGYAQWRKRGAVAGRGTARRAARRRFYGKKNGDSVTIAAMNEAHGFDGLRNAAKHLFYKRLAIRGFVVGGTSRDADADIATAKRLEKLPGTTRIVITDYDGLHGKSASRVSLPSKR